MLCGSFTESAGRMITLDDVNGRMFQTAYDLWCGKEIRSHHNIGDLLELGSVADRFQVMEVASAVEDAIMDQLSAA
jgi:hypothetical protein